MIHIKINYPKFIKIVMIIKINFILLSLKRYWKHLVIYFLFDYFNISIFIRNIHSLANIIYYFDFYLNLYFFEILIIHYQFTILASLIHFLIMHAFHLNHLLNNHSISILISLNYYYLYPINFFLICGVTYLYYYILKSYFSTWWVSIFECWLY